MQKKPHRALIGLLISGCLISTQPYAVEASNKSDSSVKPAAAASISQAPQSSAANDQQKPLAPQKKTTSPTTKGTEKKNEPLAKNAASASINAPAANSTAGKAPEAAVLPGATSKGKEQPQTEMSITTPAPGTHELRSLSIIEILLSLVLIAIFFLVLLRGNLFEHH
jgi:hypothetical protein